MEGKSAKTGLHETVTYNELLEELVDAVLPPVDLEHEITSCMLADRLHISQRAALDKLSLLVDKGELVSRWASNPGGNGRVRAFCKPG